MVTSFASRLTVPEPVCCGCGCGEVTNARQIEAIRMRLAGYRNVEIAERWEVTPGSVKAIIGRIPSRFKKGHAASAHLGVGRIEWACERCGGVGTVGIGRPIPRFCQRVSCMTEHGVGMWPSIGVSVQRAKAHKADSLQSWFHRRRQTIERRERHHVYETPDWRRRQDARRLRYRDDTQQAVDEWIREQDPEVRTLIMDRRDLIDYWAVRLDAPLGDGDGRTRHDRLVYGYGAAALNGQATEWYDPVAEAAIENVETESEQFDWDLVSENL